MNKPRVACFEHEDILRLTLSEDPEAQSVEMSPDIMAEEVKKSGGLARISLDV